MKRYINPENERYRYYVRECMNGFALQVLVVDRDENYPLVPSLAAQMGVVLPENYRMQSCTREAAEQQLDELAQLNGWVAVE